MLRFSLLALMANGALRGRWIFLPLPLYISRHVDWFSRGGGAIRAAVQ
jgi:hypothetical protein